MILEDATIHRLIIETVKGPIERGEGISPQDWINFARSIEELTIAALQRARTLTVTDAGYSKEPVTDAMVRAAEEAYANSKPDNLHDSFRDAIAAALAARQPEVR